jgi:hypothetical protein
MASPASSPQQATGVTIHRAQSPEWHNGDSGCAPLAALPARARSSVGVRAVSCQVRGAPASAVSQFALLRAGLAAGHDNERLGGRCQLVM